MTQTSDRAEPSTAAVRPDPTDLIIADFRSTESFPANVGGRAPTLADDPALPPSAA